jgi:hypothetical protein
MTFSIMPLYINDTHYKSLCIECHYAQCHYAECRDLFIVVLNFVMLSVVMMNVMAPTVQQQPDKIEKSH